MNEVLIALVIFSELPVALLVAGLILKLAWRPIQDSFPMQPIAETHFRRNFQSFSFGIFNGGFSFHVAVDDEYLHILPSLYLRAVGCRHASIPWSAIRLHEKQPWYSKQTRALIGRTDVVGPAWCFKYLKLKDRIQSD